jgi:hypothetical protein
MITTRNQKLLQVILATTAWLMLVLQFYLQIVNRTTSVTEALIRFFSYFTILTNLLVAISFTVLLFPNNKLHLSFSKNSVLTAVTVYILIVGLVYNLVLRSQWNPQGLQLIADNGLHTATPLLTLLYWFLYVPVIDIIWKQTAVWIIYPVVYLTYVLIRGSFSNFYPYFFIDVSKLGYLKAFQNASFVTLAFLAVSFILLWIGKIKSK